MKKILLTSAGFETQRIKDIFLKLIAKEPSEVRAIFVPTAAVFPGAIAYLPKCMNDLLNVGVLSENIKVFDLHCNLSYEELSEFDVIYFTGGDSQYLLDRINETHFNVSLNQFIENGGVYVGVSAGSCVATMDYPNNLGYINCTLSVHMSTGTKSGLIDTSNCPHIDLTDTNVILIQDGDCQIV